MNDDFREKAVEYSNLATEKYYEWVRLMLTLCTASLTALVVLQKHYTTHTGYSLYPLWACWICLAVGILEAAVILRGEGWAYRRLTHQIAEEGAQKTPCSGSRVRVSGLPRICKFASTMFPWTLLTAMVSLCVFAIWNSSLGTP